MIVVNTVVEKNESHNSANNYTFYADNLEIGTHNITLIFYDGLGFTIQDVVWVTVLSKNDGGDGDDEVPERPSIPIGTSPIWIILITVVALSFSKKWTLKKVNT